MQRLGLFFKGKFKNLFLISKKWTKSVLPFLFKNWINFLNCSAELFPYVHLKYIFFCLIILFSSKEWNVLPRIRRSSLLLSFLCFYVGFVPLEYVQSIPPLSTFVIVIHTFREGNHVKKSFVFWLKIHILLIFLKT